MANDVRDRMVELLPRLRRFCYALTSNLDRADDLVQETCVRALASADQWQAGTRLDSWMYRIAQNLWIDRSRAQRTRGETVSVDDALDISAEDGREVTEQRSTLQAVARAIATLPGDQQLVVAHVCIDGLSYKDTADALNIPIGTVMSRLARARRSLNEMLEGSKSGVISPEVML